MKLLLVNPNTSSTTTAAMLAIARGAAPAGVTVEAVTAKFGAALIVNPAALAVAATAVCAVVREQLDPTFHGVIVSAFGDPGLVLLRAAQHLPVTG
ncbi:MAG: hydrogenase expression protein HupH, partial [Rhodoferax sp.]|nr:hydrogenase expression protein HupH [Rhodoferax sp.]